MERRHLGNSSLEVSLVGLGCNNFGTFLDLECSRRVCHEALDCGITLFDTADIYGDRGASEVFLGTILSARRTEVVVATKFGKPMADSGSLSGASGRYIMQAAEASLRRLKTDWIDLYQVHVPDSIVPIEETLRSLEDLITQGKVRFIGCSNFPAWQVVDAMWTAYYLGLPGFICCQDQYSLLNPDAERELIPALLANGLGLLPYYPLAGGLLTGKYRKGATISESVRLGRSPELAKQFLTERNWQAIEVLRDFAARTGRSLLELAFGWLLAKPVVGSVIAGATSPDQVRLNTESAGCRLHATELCVLDRIAQGQWRPESS
jgi:aryl-alcohol dehydrogenase-like predicted oxidoreductase